MHQRVAQKCNFVILRIKLDVNRKQNNQDSHCLSAIAELLILILVPLETGMNTLQSFISYLLDDLMTSLSH